MQLLKQLWQLLKPLISRLLPGIKEELENYTTVKDNLSLDEGIIFLENNRKAYLQGKSKWTPLTEYRQGTDSRKYNNILCCQDGNRYFAVRRYIYRGIIEYIAHNQITPDEFQRFRGKSQTYCNFALGVFYNQYTEGKILTYKNTIQARQGRKKWTEYSANSVCKNIKKGLYNKNDYQFKKVYEQKAREYAFKGGFAIATLKKVIGRGHVATLTGQYYNETGHTKIMQAGVRFGRMSVNAGFLEKNLEKIKYYIWVKV
ncbi:MAG: hypothetical protein ACXADY_26685 [Candidatus Hodarchaeales archaeon]|jgi:hypothetical protein